VGTGSHAGTARWWTLPGSETEADEPEFVEARVGSGWVERLYPDRIEDAVVLTSTDGDLLVWTQDGRLVPYVGHDAEITDVAVETPDDPPVMWSASVDGSLVRWEGPDSTTVRRLEPGRPFGLSLEDGEPRLLSADGIVVRVIRGDAEVRLHHGATEVREAAFGREGEVLTLGEDGAVRVWSLPRDPARTVIGLPEHALTDGGMAGGVVFAGADDGTLRLWRPDGQALPQAFPGAPADDRAPTDDGGATWATVVEGRVRIGWRAGGRPSRVLEARSGAVRRAIVGPRGDHVAVLTDAGQVEVWTLDSDEPPRTLRAPAQHAITDVAFSGDGSRLATVSKEGDLQLWPSFSEVPLQTRGAVGLELRRVAVSDDGMSTIVAGAADGSAVWWDPAGESLDRWSMGVEAIETLRLAGDDVRLLSVDEHGRAVLSDRSGGRRILWRTEPSCRVRSADLTADGRLAAVACDSGDVRVWEEGTRPFELTILAGSARAVRFERGGSRLVVTSEDGRLHVVDPTHEALRDELMAGVEPCLVPGERRTYLAETPAVALARWRGCEEACWNRAFPDDAEIDGKTCPVERNDST